MKFDFTENGLPASSELIGISSASSSVLSFVNKNNDLLSSIKNSNKDGRTDCVNCSDPNYLSCSTNYWKDKSNCFFDSLSKVKPIWYYSGTSFLNR
jgi:hypothetical protein